MDFDGFLQHACPPLGLNWRKYRRRAARHRVNRRMNELRIRDYPSYLDFIRSDPLESENLADLMRVTVSRFFRDRPCWADLSQKALPELIAGKTAHRIFRAWSAGCCGGEEPYTMALIWLEHLQPLFPGFTIDILATDIDDSSLDRARKGLYSTGSLRETPSEVRDKWFRKHNGMWSIDDHVKEFARFEKSNLMEDLPPSGIDLVLCRYLVFTYYRGERLRKAAKRLYDAMEPGGVLMTGSREVITEAEDLFENCPDSLCLYRKLGG